MVLMNKTTTNRFLFSSAPDCTGHVQQTVMCGTHKDLMFSEVHLRKEDGEFIVTADDDVECELCVAEALGLA